MGGLGFRVLSPIFSFERVKFIGPIERGRSKFSCMKIFAIRPPLKISIVPMRIPRVLLNRMPRHVFVFLCFDEFQSFERCICS